MLTSQYSTGVIMYHLPFIEQVIYDEDDNEISFMAVIVDESFDHAFGTDTAYYIGISEDHRIIVNGEEVDDDTLSKSHWALINNALDGIDANDFLADDFV